MKIPNKIANIADEITTYLAIFLVLIMSGSSYNYSKEMHLCFSKMKPVLHFRQLSLSDLKHDEQS